MHGGTAAIIDRFYDAWSRKNAAALREPFAADGRYADPLARGDLVGKQLTDRPNPGTRSTRAGAAENVLPSKPGDRKVGGLRDVSALALQLDAELAQLNDRRSAPADRVSRERQRERRHPVRPAQRLTVP
jgi:hypothetical protein